MSETRKLAAILAADVVGYSRLAGMDEDRTLARLRALRSDLIDPTIAVHHGRIVKRTGDGVLVEFRSVVDAVRCGIEMQNGMVERNAGLPPERRIEFRVGIHLGDVVEESDGDLMGDGVNIAARLEGVATPGAICLSEDAYRQVKSRLDLTVRDLGHKQLKNIFEPIRIYSVQVNALAQTKRRSAKTSIARPQLAIGLAAIVIVLSGAVFTWTRIAPGVSVGSDAPADHAPIEPLSPTPKAEARLPIVIAAPQSHSSADGDQHQPAAEGPPAPVADPLPAHPFSPPARLEALGESQKPAPLAMPAAPNAPISAPAGAELASQHDAPVSDNPQAAQKPAPAPADINAIPTPPPAVKSAEASPSTGAPMEIQQPNLADGDPRPAVPPKVETPPPAQQAVRDSAEEAPPPPQKPAEPAKATAEEQK